MKIASLPMYDWPEVRGQNDTAWSKLRAAVGHGFDLPQTLTRPEWQDVVMHWHDPDLVFSQTCWGPLSLGLIDHVEPLAQPDYSLFPGGHGPMYRSALVARKGQSAAVPTGSGASDIAPLIDGRRVAFNSRDSLSGYQCLVQDLGHDGFLARSVETGSHRASVRVVADGRADIAAIDCRSWTLALEHEPCARNLVVVGWTSQRWGLPYITSRSTDEKTKQALKRALINSGCHAVPERREP